MTTEIEIDGFVETAEVEKLTGFTRRWISEKVKKGEFPAPDVKGRRGSAHRWRRSKIRTALAAMETRNASSAA